MDTYLDSVYLQLKANNNEISQENDDLKVLISGEHFMEINPDIGFLVAPNIFFRSIKDNFFN